MAGLFDLPDLRVFKTVVEAGGITRAAERLHRVQSNVTTRIKKLEERLGVELFLREGKQLHLTPAGQTLLDHADRLLDLADQAEAAVHDTHPQGLLRLGSMESTAVVRLPKPLATYNKRYPDVLLELRTGNPATLTEALLNGEIDAAMFSEPVTDTRLEAVVAFDEEPVIVTPKDYPPIADTAGTPETMIVFEHGCPHRKRLEDWYTSRGETPIRTIEMRSYHAMLGCVLAGMGGALLPRSVLTTFPEAKRLRIHPLSRQDYSLRTLLVWRKGMGSANVRALADIVQTAT